MVFSSYIAGRGNVATCESRLKRAVLIIAHSAAGPLAPLLTRMRFVAFTISEACGPDGLHHVLSAEMINGRGQIAVTAIDGAGLFKAGVFEPSER